MQGSLTVVELVQRLQAQSSVPVGERDVKAALQALAESVDWNTDTGRVTFVR